MALHCPMAVRGLKNHGTGIVTIYLADLTMNCSGAKITLKITCIANYSTVCGKHQNAIHSHFVCNQVGGLFCFFNERFVRNV